MFRRYPHARWGDILFSLEFSRHRRRMKRRVSLRGALLASAGFLFFSLCTFQVPVSSETEQQAVHDSASLSFSADGQDVHHDSGKISGEGPDAPFAEDRGHDMTPQGTADEFRHFKSLTKRQRRGSSTSPSLSRRGSLPSPRTVPTLFLAAALVTATLSVLWQLGRAFVRCLEQSGESPEHAGTTPRLLGAADAKKVRFQDCVETLVIPRLDADQTDAAANAREQGQKYARLLTDPDSPFVTLAAAAIVSLGFIIAAALLRTGGKQPAVAILGYALLFGVAVKFFHYFYMMRFQLSRNLPDVSTSADTGRPAGLPGLATAFVSFFALSVLVLFSSSPPAAEAGVYVLFMLAAAIVIFWTGPFIARGAHWAREQLIGSAYRT